MVENDAKALYKAGEKRLGTDERTFIQIFCERSRAHLAYVASVYHSMHGNSLKKVIFSLVLLFLEEFLYLMHIHDAFYQAVKKETSGNFEYGLLTILKCSENPAKYFAKVYSMEVILQYVIHVFLFMLQGRMVTHSVTVWEGILLNIDAIIKNYNSM